MPHFDLIIVGTGVAGRTAAEEAARAGLSTAIVDCRAFGGTCALRGCEPKKILAAAAEAALRVRGQRGHGVAGDARLDWPELIAFKRRFTDDLSESFEAGMRAAGQTPVHGVARFVAADTLEVGNVSYSADAILLGTGAKPMPLGITGEEVLIDSEAFMELAKLPERVVFVGGGFISFEFAGIAAAAGAKPVILHRSARALKGFDPDVVGVLIEQYAEWGIDVRLDTPVAGVRRSDGRAGDLGAAFAVELPDGSAVAADLVVHGAGRVPDLDGLDLPAGGVDFTRRGVAVDAQMRSTTNPRVWAAGDAAASGPPLTPVGISQARVAMANIVAPGSARWEPAVIPSAVFSQPPLCAVGLSEREAQERGVDIDVKLSDTSGWLSSQRVGLKHTAAKTIVERSTGRILGAHVLGHGAEETANLFALAITAEQTVDDLKRVLWAYPTASSEIVYWL
ncbi:MAG: NAD(P)/FAD-dependent oxidoreductase [Coriobacteriia bacterium]|nr:NAD(P)/FAD-dependent oxidoreductase [Coriobacteriia bacterium]